MTIDMNQFFQVFFDEAEELLAEMEKLLLAVDVRCPNNEQLHAIFRTAHSIKGGASTFGLTDLCEVTHVLESLLDKIRNGSMALTREHVDAFLAAKDVLKTQLDGHRHGSEVDRSAVAGIRVLLESFLPGEPRHREGAPSSVRPALTETKPDSIFRIGFPALPENDFRALVAELSFLGETHLDTVEDGRHFITLNTHKKAEDILDICAFILDPADVQIREDMSATIQAGNSQDAMQAEEEQQGYGFFEPLESFAVAQAPDQHDDSETIARPVAEILSVDPAEMDRNAHRDTDSSFGMTNAAVKREPEKHHGGQESSSIRVSVEKVDQLINLVGELVITQAMIEQRTSALDPLLHEKLLNSVNQLTRNTRALQESVMSIRMMPMDYAFSRFPRMVRDLAAKLGKEIDFVTQGAATELDKGLIERIVDPLTHLVRNSIDHGIELPEIRTIAGKAQAGRLSLSAAHQGGNIVIEVADDGAGLNRDRILAKAREKGLAISDNMTDADVWQLIFAPGFSTAEQVTDVSGRGVGMDVVMRNIKSMGGSIMIRSSKGVGTTTSISLPLTLAILDGMSVRAGREIYILPLGYVVESLQPAAAQIRNISSRGSVVKVRGEYLPLMRLHTIFDIVPDSTEPVKGVLVILESEGRRMALLVDELVGQQQVVVKNLESNYRKVAGISGATILGDGGVSLIVDVAALLRSAGQMYDEASML